MGFSVSIHRVYKITFAMLLRFKINKYFYFLLTLRISFRILLITYTVYYTHNTKKHILSKGSRYDMKTATLIYNILKPKYWFIYQETYGKNLFRKMNSAPSYYNDLQIKTNIDSNLATRHIFYFFFMEPFKGHFIMTGYIQSSIIY